MVTKLQNSETIAVIKDHVNNGVSLLQEKKSESDGFHFIELRVILFWNS